MQFCIEKEGFGLNHAVRKLLGQVHVESLLVMQTSESAQMEAFGSTLKDIRYSAKETCRSRNAGALCKHHQTIVTTDDPKYEISAVIIHLFADGSEKGIAHAFKTFG